MAQFLPLCGLYMVCFGETSYVGKFLEGITFYLTGSGYSSQTVYWCLNFNPESKFELEILWTSTLKWQSVESLPFLRFLHKVMFLRLHEIIVLFYIRHMFLLHFPSSDYNSAQFLKDTIYINSLLYLSMYFDPLPNGLQSKVVLISMYILLLC